MTPCRTFSCRSLFAAAFAMLCFGCTTQYRFQVDAVRAAPADTPAESFRVVNANPEVRADDPRFQEAAALVTTALSSKGWYEAPEGVEPDMTIEIDFGVEDTGRMVENIVWEPGPGANPEATVVRDRVFEKFVRITAREHASPPPRELWSVIVTGEDTSRDLPEYVPLLVSAGMDAMGQDPGRAETVVLTNHDERVLFVTQGL